MNPNKAFKLGKTFKGEEGKYTIIFFRCKICSHAMSIHADNIRDATLSVMRCVHCDTVGNWERI